jgi:CRP-like cAMP-binding protein
MRDGQRFETQDRYGGRVIASDLAVRLTELKSRFLEGLSTSEISAIATAGTRKRFSAGTVLANQGAPPDHLFLLLSGRARYFTTTPSGNKVILLWIAAGEITGAAALVSQLRNYLFSTEAVEGGSVLVWDRPTARQLVRRFPRLIDNAFSMAFDFVECYRAAHISLLCHSARERLAHVLLNLASGMGREVPGGFELNVRNEELASEANVTLFTASRLLNEWQRQGILEKQRGRVLLRSPERLPLGEV